MGERDTEVLQIGYCADCFGAEETSCTNVFETDIYNRSWHVI